MTTTIKTKTCTHEMTTGHAALDGTMEKRQIIRNLDLEPIKFKLVKEKGWTLENADRVEKLYKGFLLLNAVLPDEVHVPTFELDEMWHAHILATYKYMKDSQQIFGHYLHHFPYLGLRGEEDKAGSDEMFKETRRRFLEMTGLEIVGHEDELDAAECGGGGGCAHLEPGAGGRGIHLHRI